MEIQPELADLYQWELTQDEEEVEVMIKYPPTFNTKTITVSISKSKDALIIGVPGCLPFVCGKLNDPVDGFTQTSSDHVITYTFNKSRIGLWPNFIIDMHPEEKVYDPYSAFSLSIMAIEYPDQVPKKLQEVAVDLLMQSAAWGFMPAIRYFITINSSEAADIKLRELAFGLIQKAALFYNIPDMQYMLALILLQKKENIKECLECLHMAAENGILEAKSQIGRILSPFSDIEYGEKSAEKAIEIFQSVLKEQPKEPIALFEMAKLYYNGVGVPLDETKALQYYNIVKKIDPSAPELQKVELPKKKIGLGSVIMGFSVLTLAAAGSLTLFKYLKRRK